MFAADGTKYHDVLQPYTSTVENEQLFHDKSGYYTYWDIQLMCLVVNPKIFKKLGVTVKGYQDCLNPKLKGKIILADPAAASSGWRQLQTMLACMGDTFDDAKGRAYVEKIMGQSFKTNSSKDVFNLVNEGEYAVGLSYESTPAGIISLGGAVMEIVYPVSEPLLLRFCECMPASKDNATVPGCVICRVCRLTRVRFAATIRS